METFHFFHARDGWEAYRVGTEGMVTGPHTTAHQAVDAIRALYPGPCETCIHRHQIDQACLECQHVEHPAAGDPDAPR